VRICVFGDSIGKGVILDGDTGRYKSLQFDSMAPLDNYKDVHLKNYSMFGCTVAKGLSLIERHRGELAGFDHVLLEYGGNDCNFMWNEVSDNPGNKHHPKTPLESFIGIYKNAVNKIQETGAKPILLTLPPIDAKKFLHWVSKGISKENILKWLGGADMIYRWHEMYSLAVLKLAKMTGVPVVDIRSEFLCRHDLPELISNDGMHPTRKGYELILKTVCTQLAQGFVYC